MGFTKNIRDYVLIFLIIYLCVLLISFVSPHEVSTNGFKDFSYQDGMRDTRQIPAYYSSSVVITITNNVSLDLEIEYIEYDTEGPPTPYHEQVISEGSSLIDIYLNMSAIYIITISFEAQNDSNQYGKLSYDMEMERKPTLDLFTPLIIGLLLVLVITGVIVRYEWMEGRFMTNLIISERYEKFKNSNSFMLVTDYYWKSYTTKGLLGGFIFLSIIQLNLISPPNLPTITSDQLVQNISNNFLFAVFYWSYYVIVSSRIFTRDFPTIGYEMTYPIKRQYLWLAKLVYLVKEIVFANGLFLISYYLLKYAILLNISTFPEIISVLSLLSIITILWMTAYISLYLNFLPRTVAVILTMVPIILMESYAIDVALIPLLSNIDSIDGNWGRIIGMIFYSVVIMMTSFYGFITMEVSN